MLTYALVRPDVHDATYGVILSTHHTLRRAQMAQRQQADATALHIYAIPCLSRGRGTIALGPHVRIPTPHNA